MRPPNMYTFQYIMMQFASVVNGFVANLSCFAVSRFGSGNGTHMDLFRQSVANLVLRHRQIVVGLKIKPELG